MSTTESKTGTLSPEIKDLLNLLISSGQLEPYMNPSAQAEKSLDEMLEKNMNGTYKSSNQNLILSTLSKENIPNMCVPKCYSLKLWATLL